MPDSRRRALISAFAAIFMAAGADAPAATMEYVGTFVWSGDDPRLGGFSGIEITDEGKGFHVISDRTNMFWGSIGRDPSGRIRHMNIAGRAHLKDSQGQPLEGGYLGDSEGLAIAEDGRIWVSFEGLNRIVLYPNPDAAAQPLPQPPEMPELRMNGGFESLAVMADGTLVTLPEYSQGPGQPFPVFKIRDGKWSQAFTIRRDGDWRPVGADFGPDGWYYLLERNFGGILGFSSRIRRFQLSGNKIISEEMLLETSPLQYDNLEGLSVWDDGQGIRLTMISDDNFLFVQRTELVEYRLRE